MTNLKLTVEVATAAGRRPLHVAAWRAGDPESACKVLLLHGVSITHETWRYLQPALAAFADTVAIDLAGHGASPAPPGADVTMGGQRDLVPRVLDALGWRRAVLVGHSMGGGAALGVALRWPQRVVGLVQVASVAGEQPRPVQFAPLELPLGGLLMCAGTWASHLLGLDGLYGRWWSDDRELAASYLRAMRQPSHCRAVQSAVRNLTGANYRRQIDSLGDIRPPMLIVHGTADGLVPVRVARELHARLPHSELFEVAGGSHMLHEDPTNGVTERIAAFVAGLCGQMSCGGVQ